MKPQTCALKFAVAVLLVGIAVMIAKPVEAATSRIVSSSFTDGNYRTTQVGLLYTRTSDGNTICQSYLLIEPIGDLVPIATILILSGGDGKLHLFDGSIGAGKTISFVWRTRNHFAVLGPFNIAVLDAPELDDCTGKSSNMISLNGKRISDGHMEDVGLAIDDLRSQLGLPVWVMGTSRGTISAANAAAVLTGTSAPDGLVLTSSLTYDPREDRNDLDDVSLDLVIVPSLIVSHEQDGCWLTPPTDAEWLAEEIRGGSSDVKVRMFSGGLPTLSVECHALAPHGFFGIELKVVNYISKWIVKYTP